MTFASGIVSQGTIAEITKGGTISGNDATFAVTALDWYTSNVGLWISLLTLSVVGLSMMKLYSKKGKYER